MQEAAFVPRSEGILHPDLKNMENSLPLLLNKGKMTIVALEAIRPTTDCCYG
jgi:hypothetical protein